MSQKDNLLNFLKNRTTTFTLDEVNAMVNIIKQLEEPEPKAEPKKTKAK